jgi:hypothetical protein
VLSYTYEGDEPMKVYLTYYNADDIEGRGPMVLDLVFLHRKHAAEYIDSQPGSMGDPGPWSDKDFGHRMIKEVDVITHAIDVKEAKLIKIRERALSKLTADEKLVLGLSL